MTRTWRRLVRALARVNFTVHAHRAMKRIQALSRCGTEVALATKNIAEHHSRRLLAMVEMDLGPISGFGFGMASLSSTGPCDWFRCRQTGEKHECFRKNHGRNFRPRVRAGGECIPYVSAWHHSVP